MGRGFRNRLIVRVRAMLVALAITVAMSPSLSAESGVDDSAFRSEYTRLRNIDPGGDLPVHAQSWVALATRMNARFLKDKNSLSVGELIFAGDTNLRVWRANRSPGYAGRAAAFLDAAVSRSGDALSKETQLALVLRGDAALAAAESSSVARGYYERVAQMNDSLGVIAQARIQSLQGPTSSSLVPSMDLEVPRLVPASHRTDAAAKKIIVLDPGHGGYDGGARGVNGLWEKDITLDIAKRVKSFLESRYPVTVLLTREDDSFVPLARRTAFANKRNASAFVSIHLNASPGHNLHGLEAYYLDTADDEASRKLAERENGLPEGAALDDLSFILSDLIQSGKLEGSIELTHALEGGVSRSAKPIYQGSRSYGVKKGPFFVLVGAHMPCSLLEVYFVDSPADGPQLASSQFRTAAAEGIGMGLIDFLLPGKESTKVTPVKQKKRAVTKKTKRVRRA